MAENALSLIYGNKHTWLIKDHTSEISFKNPQLFSVKWNETEFPQTIVDFTLSLKKRPSLKSMQNDASFV